MSLIWFEGFDHYKVSGASSNLNAAGWSIQGGAGTSSPSTRFGVGKWGSGGSGTYTLTSALAELIIGFAYRRTSTGWSGISILAFSDSASGSQLWIGTAQDGTFSVRRQNSAGALLLSTSTKLMVDVWTYIELRVKVNDTTGTLDLRVNGTSVGTASNIDTKQTANANIQQIVMQAGCVYDDMYIIDPTVGGAPWNDFLGDVQIQTLFATADDSVQFTPLSSTNVSNIDETATDDDTTYNSSSTNNHVDTFVFNDLTGTPTIYGVAAIACLRKDAAPAENARTKLISGATTDNGTTTALTTTYAMYRTQYQNDPNTAAQWTATNVNAAKAGYERVS